MIRQLENRSFRAVGTTCSVAVAAGRGERRPARHAIEAAVAEIDACEAALSRFDSKSDLSRLNREAGSWVDVDVRLLEALSLAVEARCATNGRFDPTILPALVAAGYDRSFEQLEERPPRTADGWSAGAVVEIGIRSARVATGAAVDLGGIGKGYAASRALVAMHEAWPDLPGALIDLGGDIALVGSAPEGGPWKIDILDPRNPARPPARLLLSGGGVATTGGDVRRYGPGRRLHHLIDPATGAPAVAGPLAVTVVAPDAAQAEAHATALAISTETEAAAHIAAHPQLSAHYIPHAGPPLVLGQLPAARIQFGLAA
jgi:thiamine biosynthesis lipoprotein